MPYLVLGTVQARRDAPTVDEAVLIASGTAALVHRDLRLDVAHPPLPKVAAALLALTAGPHVPRGPAWERGDEFDYADRFLTTQRREDRLRAVVFRSRLVPLLVGLLAAAAAYALAAGLFGRLAGLVPAAALLTTPFFLGHAHLATTDVALAAAALATALALRRHLSAPGPGRAALVGLACGAALLCRNNALALLVVAAVVVALASAPRWRTSAVHAGVVVAVAVACIWVGYRGLAPDPPDGAARDRLEALVDAAAGREGPLATRPLMAAPLPLEYRAGVAYQAVVANAPHEAYLLGRAWTGARWWFWPASMAVKLPAGVLLVLLLGAWGWRGIDAAVRRRALFAVVLPAAVLTVFVLVQPAPTSLRYLLPALALWLVAAAPAVRVLTAPAARVAAAILLASQLAFLLESHPHSLAWTAPPFRPGYRYAADGDLDWGQDLWRLERWAPGRRPLVALYAPRGTSEADVPGARRLRDAEPDEVRGWVAVSASLLTTYDRDRLAWLRRYCPVGTLGGTILLYRFEAPPVASTAPGRPSREPAPAMPPSPCPGPYSRLSS